MNTASLVSSRFTSNGRDAVSASIVAEAERSGTLTPTLGVLCLSIAACKKLLAVADAANVNIRPRSPKVVRNYAAEMQAGRWPVTTIYIDESGIVWDGQHRLDAAIRSGVPLEVRVVVSDDEDERNAVTGKPRLLTDYMRAWGVPNRDKVAVALRLLHLHLSKRDAGARGADCALSTSRARQLLAEHPGVLDCVSLCLRARSVVGPGLLAYIGYVGEYSPNGGQTNYLEEFVEGVATGAMLEEDDPRHRLRTRMLNDKASKASIPSDLKNALTILAWNCFAAGQKLKVLRYSSVGPMAKPFPKVAQVPLIEEGF